MRLLTDEDRLKEGDIVMLKSGGPAMTVSYLEEDGGRVMAFCLWFVGTDLKTSEFSPPSLKAYVPDLREESSTHPIQSFEVQSFEVQSFEVQSFEVQSFEETFAAIQELKKQMAEWHEKIRGIEDKIVPKNSL